VFTTPLTVTGTPEKSSSPLKLQLKQLNVTPGGMFEAVGLAGKVQDNVPMAGSVTVKTTEGTAEVKSGSWLVPAKTER
jgi:hypothetical protein